MYHRAKGAWAWVMLITCSLLFPVGARAADTINLNITAYIDGQDLLVVQGNTLQWHHLDFCAVGIWGGGNVPTTISTTINGVVVMDNFEWTPSWPSFAPCPDQGSDFPAFSSVFTGLTPPLPSADTTVTLTPIQARGTVTIVQNPSAANGDTLIVDFNDDPEAGPATYQVQLAITKPIGKPVLSSQTTSQTEVGTLLTLFVNFTNVGSETAQNILLETVSPQTTGGTGTVTLLSPALPLNVGGEAVGGGGTVPFQFNVPATVTEFSVTEAGTLQDLKGNTYKFSVQQVVLP